MRPRGSEVMPKRLLEQHTLKDPGSVFPKFPKYIIEENSGGKKELYEGRRS